MLSGGIGFVLGIFGGDKIKGYINKKVDGISERVGENIAKKMYEQNSVPAPDTTIQQAIDYAKLCTVLEKLPDKIGYKVEKSVEKVMKQKKKKRVSQNGREPNW